MKPATEKKCEFDFLESNGMMPDYQKKLMDNTENKVHINVNEIYQKKIYKCGIAHFLFCNNLS